MRVTRHEENTSLETLDQQERLRVQAGQFWYFLKRKLGINSEQHTNQIYVILFHVCSRAFKSWTLKQL